MEEVQRPNVYISLTFPTRRNGLFQTLQTSKACECFYCEFCTAPHLLSAVGRNLPTGPRVLRSEPPPSSRGRCCDGRGSDDHGSEAQINAPLCSFSNDHLKQQEVAETGDRRKQPVRLLAEFLFIRSSIFFITFQPFIRHWKSYFTSTDQ